VPPPQPPAAELTLESMTASKVGARPVLPTPMGGALALQPPPGLVEPSPAARPATVPPVARPGTVPPGASGTLGASDGAQRMRPRTSSGLAATGGPIVTTQIGVPPPPLVPPRPTTEEVTAPPPARSRRWLVVVGVLALLAAGALAVVLAT
jgi:hypothetical protein